MTPTLIGEYHITRRPILNPRLRHGLTIALGLTALLGVYAGVQLYEDNVLLREQVNTLRSTAPRAGAISKCFLQMRRTAA